MRVYSFNDLSDHIYYFNSLIGEVLNFKDQFNRCLNDIKDLDASLNTNIPVGILEFEALSRRKDGILRFLCNLLADETKGAVSFKKYRKKLKKDGLKYGITFLELPASLSAKLNELNQLRNWSLHYPESLFLSEKSLLQGEGDTIPSHLILRPNYKFYEREYLTKMIEELTDLSNCFEEIFNQMISDYELLIGKRVSIIKMPITVKQYDLMQVVSGSWDMQTS